MFWRLCSHPPDDIKRPQGSLYVQPRWSTWNDRKIGNGEYGAERPVVGRTVDDHRGKQGGFLLARDASKISFADMIRCIDGPLALAPCASKTAYRPCPECRDVRTCELRATLIEARDATAAILDRTIVGSGLAKH